MGVAACSCCATFLSSWSKVSWLSTWRGAQVFRIAFLGSLSTAQVSVVLDLYYDSDIVFGVQLSPENGNV